MNPHAHAPRPWPASQANASDPGGIAPASLRFRAGRIDDSPQAASDAPWFDAGGLLVLPGIVDLHGDAFERAVMPRPGVTFPYDSALFDVDRQLLANGITTEFHGLTLSWEGGLRGEAYAERMFDSLERMREALGAALRASALRDPPCRRRRDRPGVDPPGPRALPGLERPPARHGAPPGRRPQAAAIRQPRRMRPGHLPGAHPPGHGGGRRRGRRHARTHRLRAGRRPESGLA